MLRGFMNHTHTQIRLKKERRVVIFHPVEMDKTYTWGTEADQRTCQECADYLSPMKVDVIITHQGCLDGELSAVLMTMHRVAKPIVCYAQPGMPLSQTIIDECYGRRVLVVDIAPNKDDYDLLETTCTRIAVLDHHEANLCHSARISFFCVSRLCGASAMYYYMSTRIVIDDALILQVIDNVHQYDLWSFTGTRDKQEATKAWSRALYKKLQRHSNRTELIHSVCTDKKVYREVVELGRHIAPLVQKAILDLKKKARVCMVRGTRIIIIDTAHVSNASSAINECGTDINSDTGLPVCFTSVVDKTCRVSCRGVGALEFAKKFERGGGHSESAGFQLSVTQAKKEQLCQ